MPVPARFVKHLGTPTALASLRALLAAGAAPDSVPRVITASTLDSASAYRQYAIATVVGGLTKFAQFTGDSTVAHHGDRRADDVLVRGNSPGAGSGAHASRDA